MKQLFWVAIILAVSCSLHCDAFPTIDELIKEMVDTRIMSAMKLSKGNLNGVPGMGSIDNSRQGNGMPPNFNAHHGMDFPGANQHQIPHSQSGGPGMSGNSMDGQHPLGYQSQNSGMNFNSNSVPNHHQNSPMAGGGAVNGNFPMSFNQGNSGHHH